MAYKFTIDEMAKIYKKELSGYDFNYAERFFKVLVYEWNKKAKNLEWLFGDKHTIEVALPAETVLQSAKQSNGNVAAVYDALVASGASFTPEQFINNQCIIDKQQVKISTFMRNADSYMKIDEDTLVDVLDIKNIKVVGVIDKAVKPYNIYDDIIYYNGQVFILSELKNITTGSKTVAKVMRIDGKLFLVLSNGNIVPAEFFTITYSNIHKIKTIDSASVFSALKTNTIFISIHPAELLHAATGSNVSSCMSIGSSYHPQGAVQYLRDDFSALAYTKAPGSVYDKTGRQWVHFKLYPETQDSPFLYFANPYGSFRSNAATLTRVRDFVIKMANEELISTEQWQAHTNGLTGIHFGLNTGANNLINSGGSHTHFIGYFDRSGGTLMFLGSNPTFKNRLLLNFKDGIDVNGLNSNVNVLNKNSHSMTPIVYPDYIFSTCASCEGEIIDSVKAFHINGNAICDKCADVARTILEPFLDSGKLKPQVEEEMQRIEEVTTGNEENSEKVEKAIVAEFEDDDF